MTKNIHLFYVFIFIFFGCQNKGSPMVSTRVEPKKRLVYSTKPDIPELYIAQNTEPNADEVLSNIEIINDQKEKLEFKSMMKETSYESAVFNLSFSSMNIQKDTWYKIQFIQKKPLMDFSGSPEYNKESSGIYFNFTDHSFIESITVSPKTVEAIYRIQFTAPTPIKQLLHGGMHITRASKQCHVDLYQGGISLENYSDTVKMNEVSITCGDQKYLPEEQLSITISPEIKDFGFIQIEEKTVNLNDFATFEINGQKKQFITPVYKIRK